MNTYRPDHNGECTHCDEPLDAHRKADGARHTRETENRLELLTWLTQHVSSADTIEEVGMVATGTAVSGFVKALIFGAQQLESSRS